MEDWKTPVYFFSILQEAVIIESEKCLQLAIYVVISTLQHTFCNTHIVTYISQHTLRNKNEIILV